MRGLTQKEHAEKYAAGGYFWGVMPNKYVARIGDYLSPPGSILDLGAGEGRNSIFLAKQGFSITAIDINETGLSKIQRASDNDNLDIRSELADISTYATVGEYDAIIANAALHFIEAGDISRIINNIQGHTKKGGVNLFTLFSTDDPGVLETPDYYFFSEEELRRYYKDWEIELLEHYQKHETHGAPHDHDFLALVARKK